jgi:hypothetical protein
MAQSEGLMKFYFFSPSSGTQPVCTGRAISGFGLTELGCYSLVVAKSQSWQHILIQVGSPI